MNDKQFSLIRFLVNISVFYELLHHFDSSSQLADITSYLHVYSKFLVPYFFGYKTGFFSFQNNPKVLDPSCKMDLELWHCLGRVELVL